MAHEESLEHLSPEEKKFRFYITRGEDFMRCEIYRNAKKYYQLALEMNIDNNTVTQKISDCNRLIKQESRIIYILIAVAAVIIALVSIF